MIFPLQSHIKSPCWITRDCWVASKLVEVAEQEPYTSFGRSRDQSCELSGVRVCTHQEEMERWRMTGRLISVRFHGDLMVVSWDFHGISWWFSWDVHGIQPPNGLSKNVHGRPQKFDGHSDIAWWTTSDDFLKAHFRTKPWWGSWWHVSSSSKISSRRFLPRNLPSGKLT